MMEEAALPLCKPRQPMPDKLMRSRSSWSFSRSESGASWVELASSCSRLLTRFCNCHTLCVVISRSACVWLVAAFRIDGIGDVLRKLWATNLHDGVEELQCLRLERAKLLPKFGLVLLMFGLFSPLAECILPTGIITVLSLSVSTTSLHYFISTRLTGGFLSISYDW